MNGTRHQYCFLSYIHLRPLASCLKILFFCCNLAVSGFPELQTFRGTWRAPGDSIPSSIRGSLGHPFPAPCFSLSSFGDQTLRSRSPRFFQLSLLLRSVWWYFVLLSMSFDSQIKGQVLRVPTTAKYGRSLAPVSRFMQTFGQDERIRVFLNQNGIHRDSESMFDVQYQFYISY